MENKNIYVRFSAILFFFFLSWSVSYKMISIWLGQAIHLNGASIGFLFSINGIFTLVMQPLYGYILDKLGNRKNLLLCLSGVLILTGPFFKFIYGPLLQANFLVGAIIGGIFIGSTYLASLGTAIAAFFAGSMFNINPNYNFRMGSIAAIVVFLIIATTKIDLTDVEVEKSDTVKVSSALDLFKLKDFWIFIVFIIGIASMYTIYDQQFPRYFAEQFATLQAGNQMYGYLNSLQTFLEAGMMFLAPKIVNKLGIRNSMLLVGLLLALRIILTSVATGPILISIIKLIQSFDMPILYISIFKYINHNFEAKWSSIMYLVGYQFISQIGVISFSPLMGKMYDVVGYQTAYVYLGIIVCLFVVISFFTLKKDSQVSVEVSE